MATKIIDLISKNDINMTEGSIWRHLLHFSIPMAIGLLFQHLYNTVDTLVVGRLVGQQAQAAVGSTGPIINTIVGFCAGLAGGASVVISQRYGAHDSKGLSKAVHSTIALTALTSVLAMVVGQLMLTLKETADCARALHEELRNTLPDDFPFQIFQFWGEEDKVLSNDQLNDAKALQIIETAPKVCYCSF